MARIEFSGITELQGIFGELHDDLDEVADDMLETMGDVVMRTQRITAHTMLQGRFNRGAVESGIRKSGVKTARKGGKIMFIEFIGKQHGEDVSTIAYINEYGKTNQPARPFIATANAKCENEAVNKAASVLFNHYSRKGL